MSIKITEEGKTLLEDAILQDKKVVFSQIELIADVEKSPTEMVKRVDVSKVSASDYNTITVQAQIDNDGFLDTYYFNRANVYADEVLFAYDDGINICIPAETTKVINDLEMMMKIDSAVADLKIIYEGYVLRKDFDDMESKIQKINTTIKDMEANAVTQNDCTDQVSWNSQIVKKEFLTIGNMAFFRATGGFSTSRGSIVLATIPQGYFPETTRNQSSYELMGVFTSAYDKERRNCYVTLNCLSGNVDLQINNNEAYSDTRSDDNVQMIFYGFWKMNAESQGGTGGSINYREDIEKLRQSIQDSKKEIVRSGREIDSLKEDISKYKKTLKSSDLEWSNATCYNGILSSDATILTSEIFSLKKGDTIYFDNENIRTRITTYNADGTYKSNTGGYVHFDTYNITNDGLLYRISIGVLNGDLSNNASLIKYVRFSEAYVYEKYTPSEKFENDMYNHKKIKPTWTQGSVYQGKIDSSILANISSELFYAPKGTKIIIPSGYQVRISFFDESGTFLNSYGYAYYQQYTLFEDSYIRLSLYDGTNPMDISKGNNVQIVKDEFESLSRVSKLEEKTTSLEEKTTSLEEKTTSLEENVLGYTGSKISVVENTMIFRKKISYSKTKWGEKTWSGGLAIYNNMAIVGYNMGYLALFDICQNKLIATGKSTIFGTNHANNLSFDYENIVNVFPVMYLTRASVGYSECYVESLKVESDNLITNLVQTISYNGQYLDNIHDVNWCIDRSSNELVAIIYETSEKVNILKFKKPLLDNGDITFTDNDIIKVISSNNISTLQGSDIANGKLFITDGYSNGFLKVISLESGELINSIPLSSASQAEPEGICIYENKIYVNFHEKNDIECLLYEFIV